MANLFVKALQWLHLALQKFHRLTGMLDMGKANLGDMINNGQCCDLGDFSRTRLSGKRLSESALANARSGFVPLFQRQNESWQNPLEYK